VLFCCCGGFPFNLLGLVFSLIGLSQINRHPELYEGRSQAIAGLVLSIASLLLIFFCLVWSLATDNFQVNGRAF
jgi:sulfite exporter TauE/SafE